MKFMKIIVASLALCLFCSSCSSLHTKSPTGTDTLAVSLNATKFDADVAVDMSNKIQGSATGTYWIGGLLKMGGDSSYLEGYGGFGRLGDVKSAAAFNALDNTGYDVLVSPAYIVHKTTTFFGLTVHYKVEVSGYGGTVQDITNAE